MVGYVLYDAPLDKDRLYEALRAVHKAYDHLSVQLDSQIVPKFVKGSFLDAIIEEIHIPHLDQLEELLEVYNRTPFKMVGSLFYEYRYIYINHELKGLYFKYHHIIMDAVSVSNILRAIENTYFGIGKKTIIPYENFLLNETRFQESELFQKHENYWVNKINHLKSLDPTILRPDSYIYNTKRYTYDIDNLTTKALYAYLDIAKCSIFRFMIALLSAYFYRLSDNKQITIMSGHHGRNADNMSMIGMTVSTLPLINTIDGCLPFNTFLKDIKGQIRDDLKHQAYPFNLMAPYFRKKEIDPDTLFRVSLNHIPEATDLKGHVVRMSPQKDYVYLNFKINPNQGSIKHILHLGVDYRSDLYNEDEIRYLFSRLKTMIQAVIERPETPIDKIPILSTEEVNQLYNLGSAPKDKRISRLYPSSDDKVPLSNKQLIIDEPINKWFSNQFEGACLKYADQFAIYNGPSTITYKELSLFKNDMLTLLSDVNKGDIVAVKISRSLYIAPLFLACIEKEAIFLPMDKALTIEATQYQLNHCHSEWYITDSDDELKIYSQSYPQPINNTEVIVRRNGCYMIFTSGSTGQPKAVVISYAAYKSFCIWYMNYFHITDKTKSLSYCSYGFDVSLSEYIPPLLIGGSVIMTSETERHDMTLLISTIDTFSANLVTLPTKVGLLLMNQSLPLSVKQLIVAGEALHEYNSQPYTVYNAYGPTECTIYCSVKKLEHNLSPAPIGKPTSDTVMLLLNEDHSLTPYGEIGEIYIGGSQVATGYYESDPSKFLSELYVNGCTGNEVDNRVYHQFFRSGDMARIVHGEMIFVGRYDRQFKHNGNRIDLSGIECQFMQVPGVTDICVTLENNVLIAYYVAHKGITQKDIKIQLINHLPEYMIPSIMIELPELPRNRSGKTDEMALRQLSLNSSTSVLNGPLTQSEETMAKLWTKVLKKPIRHLTDDFFHSGGDSLKIMNLLLLIEEAFDVKCPYGLIYTNRRLKDFTGAVLASKKETVLYKLNQSNSPNKIICLFDYSGESLAYGNIGNYYPQYQVLGTRFTQDMGQLSTIKEIANRIVAEIQSLDYQVIHLLGYSFGGLLAIEVSHQLEEKGISHNKLCIIDCPSFVAYKKGQLYRFTLSNALGWLSQIRNKDKRHYLRMMIKKVINHKFNLYKVFHIQRQINHMIQDYKPCIHHKDMYLIKSKHRKKDPYLGWDKYYQHIHVTCHNKSHKHLLNKSNMPHIQTFLGL